MGILLKIFNLINYSLLKDEIFMNEVVAFHKNQMNLF
jgi:hypothetical protein